MVFPITRDHVRSRRLLMPAKSFPGKLQITQSASIGAQACYVFLFCYTVIAALRWRYRLGVRTEDSQSSNPGSIPGSATKKPVIRNLAVGPRRAGIFDN